MGLSGGCRENGCQAAQWEVGLHAAERNRDSLAEAAREAVDVFRQKDYVYCSARLGAAMVKLMEVLDA